jgi:hypothetical protein
MCRTAAAYWEPASGRSGQITPVTGVPRQTRDSRRLHNMGHSVGAGVGLRLCEALASVDTGRMVHSGPSQDHRR